MTGVLILIGRIVVTLAMVALVAGCGSGQAPSELPEPTPGQTVSCGGLRSAVAEALPCDRVVRIALDALRARTPDQIARGIASIDVSLAPCPRGEVPPQIDCTDAEFAQMVTVTFHPAPPGGPIEESLTVAVEPVTGRVLGIANPLIR